MVRAADDAQAQGAARFDEGHVLGKRILFSYLETRNYDEMERNVV